MGRGYAPELQQVLEHDAVLVGQPSGIGGEAEGGDQTLDRTGAVGVGLVNRPIVKHANGDSGIADVDGQQHLQEPG